MTEADLMRLIQIRASVKGDRLLRNNVGVYRIGKRFIRYGLGRGSSDLIGWKSVVITPDMVGSTVAVFYACEVKVDSPTTKDQAAFLKAVIESGGIGIIARSEDDI